MPPRLVGRYSADPGPPRSLQSGSGRQVVVDVTTFSNNIRYHVGHHLCLTISMIENTSLEIQLVCKNLNSSDPLTRVVHAKLLFAVFVGNPPLGDHRRVGGT